MTWGGMILMVMSVGLVAAFFIYCLIKVLRTPEATEHMHGQLDIDTRDHEE